MTSISSASVKSIETSQKVTVTFVRFKASIVTCNFACIVFAEISGNNWKIPEKWLAEMLNKNVCDEYCKCLDDLKSNKVG